MRVYNGIKVLTEDEFESAFGGNWMVTDKDGKYTHVAAEAFIIEECKDSKGKRSVTPYIAVDNIDGCCFMEEYATIGEAETYIKENTKWQDQKVKSNT